ncbi:hypothetical protein E1H12_09935 [Geitlerinema sp. P-1104]|uniref:hypothetical protein n=1 Tax=Geitlerinema sp. P-1104 TaxID=2546230 RepID=UPI001476E59D|nr:hypothetical protein [Geitlerinema sp. P-1104]NMG58836.1 hypothetical protein [Geitlerinema sp. P-1104]
MYQKKVLPLFGQSQNTKPQTGYFVNEIFWNLLLHPQLEQVKQSAPPEQPKVCPLAQTNP